MKKTRLLAFLLTACLATTCFLSGTVAKYSTKESADDSARVARWSFTVDPEGSNKDITKEDFVFDLFNTIKNTDDANEEHVDVDGTGTETVIAPGTQGSFKLILKNTSEVKAEYKINFGVENTNNIPVEFQVVKTGDVRGDAWTSWSDFNNGTLNVYNQDDDTGVDLVFGAEAVEYTVYWRWQFERGADTASKETNNKADTDLGIATPLPTLKVTATIIAEQVD